VPLSSTRVWVECSGESDVAVGRDHGSVIGLEVGTERGAGRKIGRVTEPDDSIAVLPPWAGAGAVWRVVDRRRASVTVALYQCDGGEEVDRINSTDPRLLRYLAGRTGSED